MTFPIYGKIRNVPDHQSDFIPVISPRKVFLGLGPRVMCMSLACRCVLATYSILTHLRSTSIYNSELSEAILLWGDSSGMPQRHISRDLIWSLGFTADHGSRHGSVQKRGYGMFQVKHQKIASERIKYHQISSNDVKYHQISSNIIKCHQISSTIIKGCQ